MKIKLLSAILILAIIATVFISGCVQDGVPPADGKDVQEEVIGPGGFKTPEEHKKYCEKNIEECKTWCKENPEMCQEDIEPQKTEKDKFVPHETDSSIVWESMNGPPGAGNIQELIQNPYRHNELYAATGKALYKSEDKGESWQKISESEKSSIAAFEDKLFTCREGVHYYDNEGNPVKILDMWCSEIIVSDNRLFMGSGGVKIRDIKILYADLTSGNFDFKDISPSESELRDLTLSQNSKGARIQTIVVVGNRVLANIIVAGEDRGQLTKSYLYVSEDLGGTWSLIELGEPDGVSITKIAQNPDNPEHLVLSFKHNIVHEGYSPISELLRESFDGGKTWNKPVGLTLESDDAGKWANSNGIEDVVILGSAYYLLSPYGGPAILKLEGSHYEEIRSPRIEVFKKVGFNLDKLLFDFDDPNIVYGKTGSIWALGILKSVDGMKTWKKMDRDIIESSPTIVMTHPTDPNAVFTSGNVIQESYVTRDFGETWDSFSPVSAGDDVKIDPHNPEHILLVDEMTEIYESYDAGRTFTRIAREFSSAKIFDFEIAKDSGKIYAANIGVGISVSDPSEDGWQYLTNSPDYTYDIEIDPENSGIIYATYSPKIFENYSSVWRYSQSQRENSGWSEILKVKNSKGITTLEFDPSNPNKIYAGAIGEKGEIYFSNDKGKNWGKLNEHFTMLTVWGQSQLVVDPNNPSIAYIATWLGGTWKTTNAGETWTLLEDAPISSTALSLDKSNTNVIYLADRSSPTVWKSADGGGSWEQVADFASDRALLVMRVLADGDTVYASTFFPSLGGGKLYKSTDAGVNWSDITSTLPKGILDLAVDPTNPDIIYLVTNINGTHKSTDGGVTWNKMENFPDVGTYDIEVDPNDTTILYASARGGSLPSWFTEIGGRQEGIVFTDDAGVYKSTDSGATWNKILTTTASCRAIRRHPDNPNLLFAPDLVDGLQVSADSGETWTKYNEGLNNAVTTSVAVNGDKIYVGTQACGVYSGDLDITTGKITWQPKRSNKPVPEVYNLRIEVDPTNSDNIFVSSYPGGMFASTDGGVTFRDRSAITPSVVVFDPLVQGYYSFAIDPNNQGKMWLGTWGRGIYKSYNSMLLNVPKNLFGKHINQVVIDPKDSDTIYVGTQEGVFVTKDDGESWQEMNNGLETLDVKSLKITSTEQAPFEYDFEKGTAEGWKFDSGWSVIKENGNYVLQGVAHEWATAGSESWSDYTFESKVKLVKGDVHINYRVSGASRYAIGMGEGNLYLMRSTEGKQETDHAQLESVNVSFSENKWYDIKIVGKENNIKVYVNDSLKIDYTDDKPVLNGRIAFESLSDSKIQVDDVVVTLDSTGAEIYAGTAGYGIYKFNNASKTWQNLGGTLGGGFWTPWERRMYQFSSILFDPDVPGKIYYGHFPSGFFISEDNGHTWKDSSLKLGNDGMFSLSMHPHNHDILFAGTYNGIAKSVDRGKTWEMISSGMPSEQWPYTIAIDDENPNIMYTSTKNGQNMGFCERNDFCGVVMKTTDGGESWFKIMNGLDEFRSEFYTLLIYPPNHNILFLSTNRGVYISRDSGDSWKAINTGLPNTDNQVRDNVADNLALTPDNKYLIFGLMDSGAWKADLSGAGLGS